MLRKIFMIVLLLVFIIPGFSHAVNDITGQTWLLDTAGSITTEPTHIVWIIWSNITNDSDDLVINVENGGDLVVKLKGKAGVDMIVPFPGDSGYFPTGFYLQTIDSGNVQVRLGKSK